MLCCYAGCASRVWGTLLRYSHCFSNTTLESEIELIEVFSRAKVIAITISHEDMTDNELEDTVAEYENRFGLPTMDVLKRMPSFEM